MRLDKLTLKSQEAVEGAQKLAESRKHPEITPEHLCFVIVSQPDGIARPLFEKLGVGTTRVESETEKSLERLPQVSGADSGQYFSQNLKKVFDSAFDEAHKLNDEYV